MTDTFLPTEDLDSLVTMIATAVALGDHETALSLCEAVLAVDPADADAMLIEAAVLDDLDRPDEARNVLERCTARHGDLSAAWRRLGDHCVETADAERAVEAYREWQRLDGVNAETELALAWASLVALDLESARSHAAGAIAAGGGKEADELAGRLAAIDDVADLESEVGWWLSGTRSSGRGLELLISSLARRENPVARYRLGAALLRQGRAAESVPHLRYAVESAPTVHDWQADLGTAQLLTGDLEGAEASFAALLRSVPGDATGLLGRGRVTLQRGDPDQAITLAEKVLAADPQDAGAWMLRTDCMAGAGRTAEALVSAEHAIVFAPDDRFTWAAAADAADALGWTTLAHRYRARADIRLSGSLGIAEGDDVDDPAVEVADELHDLDRIVVADPLVRAIYRHRAGIAHELGLPARAHSYLRAAIARGVVVDDADAMCDLGSLLLMAGDAAGARAHFETVLTHDGGNDRASAGMEAADELRREDDEEKTALLALDRLDREEAVLGAAQRWTPTHEAPPDGFDAFDGTAESAEPVARLEPGLPVELLRESQGWALVRCENGWECWVAAVGLVGRAETWSPTHRVPSSGLLAFASPSSETRAVDRIDPGLEVEVVGRLGAWAHVRFENGWSCWVEAHELEAVS